MITINITEEKQTHSEMAELLRHIADKIELRFTRGYYPHWDLKGKEKITEEEDAQKSHRPHGLRPSL